MARRPMSRKPRPWQPYRPGPLRPLAEDLWTVDDEVPGLKGATRRMTVVRRRDGALLFYNAIPVHDSTLTQIRALGTPAQLVIPNQFHALDAPAFVKKLQVTPYAPPVAIEALASCGPCRPIGELPQDEALQVFTVEGFKTREVALVVGTDDKTLLVADLVTNAPHAAGWSGFLMRAVGFTGPQPVLPRPVRWRVGRDLRSVAGLLRGLAAIEHLTRLVPTHGKVVVFDVREQLKRIADSL